MVLAIWRFSENSADPDLWGHVLFGQRMIQGGKLEKTEPFSWTEPGHPWINHEVGAELTMGAAHRLLGGPGLLLLAMAAGLFTFGLALQMGAQSLQWPERGVAWGIAALAAKEIAYGFAVRPQIFTAVALVLMLFCLRKIHSKKYKYALVLPVLFLLWINTHGGALAGFILLTAATCAGIGQLVLKKYSGKPGNHLEETDSRTLVVLSLSFVASAAALACNPWGLELIKWLIRSVLWVRPEISEWNPPTLGADRVPFFALVVISIVAFALSRRKRWLWEISVLSALGLVALRHTRHVPLFSIAALALVPPHLADVISRFRDHFENLKDQFTRPAIRGGLSALLLIASTAIVIATLTYKKENPFTIEVPREEYPVAALKFIREKELRGNLLVYFDWGEQCLWELPESPVSIDGRLDTCYSRDLLREHWNFYDAKPVDKRIFDFNKADFALLRTNVAGIFTLKKETDWKLVYEDRLAVILVRRIDRFPRLQGVVSPETFSRAMKERDTFPSTPSKNSSFK